MPVTMVKDSTAKETSGRIAISSNINSTPTEMGVLAPRSLTRETWELFPVTVVKDLRLPTNHWLKARTNSPTASITTART